MAKILIVDDSDFIRVVLKNILQKGGYQDVIEASNGAEAVEKATTQSPDLVLLDIVMPDMDGMDVLEKISSQTKVCMVTAVGQTDMTEKAKELGAADYLTKPFEEEKVLEVVKKLLS